MYCEHCGVELSVKELNNRSSWQYNVMCEKHKKYAGIDCCKRIRIPRVAKKRIKVFYKKKGYDVYFTRGLTGICIVEKGCLPTIGNTIAKVTLHGFESNNKIHY